MEDGSGRVGEVHDIKLAEAIRLWRFQFGTWTTSQAMKHKKLIVGP